MSGRSHYAVLFGFAHLVVFAGTFQDAIVVRLAERSLYPPRAQRRSEQGQKLARCE